MKTFIAMLIVVFVALSVNAQKIKVGADPSVDMSKYKTYAWDKGMPARNPLINQMIIDSVDQALVAKGLKKVDTNPELTVVSIAALDADLQMSYPSWSNAMGSAASTGIDVGTQMWTVHKGVLVIDIADANTKNTVWRGSANGTLSHGPTGDTAKDAKNVEKQVKKSVEKMFKQYPRPS